MDEARKTNRVRGDEFIKRYMNGVVIDIGCGPDLVVPHAVPFDIEHGDAQFVARYFDSESFDCVHSSHCLEHMRDAPAALQQWWQLVKPGGHLIVVVPHEDLYEQGLWPSRFNPDHKATFRIGGSKSWSPVSHDIGRLVRDLPNAEVVDEAIHDSGYVHRRIKPTARFAPWLMGFAERRERLLRAWMRRGVPVYQLNLLIDRLEWFLGKPVDQTMGDAMAQIQVVARKCRD